jgi:hypothetical protein
MNSTGMPILKKNESQIVKKELKKKEDSFNN